MIVGVTFAVLFAGECRHFFICRALPIHFIGVWDTVAALGLPRRASVLSDPYNEYHQTGLPYYMTHARHALAIHELRGDFRPLLWHGTHPHNPGQTLKQTWFAGARR